MVKVGPSEVNKLIRRVVSPALRECGFTKVRTRNNWKYLEDRVWYIMIRSVGSYFSDVTGYPPQSLTAEYGVYFTDFPPNPRPALSTTPKTDKDGLVVPKEHECHYRNSLENISSQKKLRISISSEVERRRTDVWWISPDGSNMEEAVEDIRLSLLQNAIPKMERVEKATLLERWLSHEHSNLTSGST